jgi:chromosome segregation ATPase
MPGKTNSPLAGSRSKFEELVQWLDENESFFLSILTRPAAEKYQNIKFSVVELSSTHTEYSDELKEELEATKKEMISLEKDKDSEISDLNDEIKSYQREVEELKNDVHSLEKANGRYEDEVTSLKEEIINIQTKQY